MTERLYTHSATSYRTSGSGLSCPASTSLKTDSRLPSRFWKGCALYAALHSRTASATSPRLVKVRLRSWAITQVAASLTVPSADAFCLGFLTCAGMMAVT